MNSPHAPGPLPPPTRVATYGKQVGGSHNPPGGDVSKEQPRHEKAIPMGPE